MYVIKNSKTKYRYLYPLFQKEYTIPKPPLLSQYKKYLIKTQYNLLFSFPSNSFPHFSHLPISLSTLPSFTG